MADSFPLLIGRVGLSGEVSVHLPRAFKQRFEDRQMVLWRPGFTIWLSLWDNPRGESVEQRKAGFAAAASPDKFDEIEAAEEERLYYSYRLAEHAADNRAAAFYGFAFYDTGSLHLSMYFDREVDVELAQAILRSANDLPPTLDNPKVLSQRCFASNRVMKGGNPVGFMYREVPDASWDSGWRFFSGDEPQEYVDDPTNFNVYPVAIVAESDLVILPYLKSKPGSKYVRQGDRFLSD
jgi:hypothetical protein